MEQERKRRAIRILERAWKVARRIRYPDDRLEAYLEIARTSFAVGARTLGQSFLERALRGTRRIAFDPPEGMAFSLMKIAEVFMEAGDADRAREMLEEALKIGQGSDDAESRTLIFRKIGPLFFKLGEQERGRALLYEALENAEFVLFEKDRQWEYLEIGNAFLEIGDAKGARAAAEKIYMYWRDELLSDICAELARQGEVEQAFNIANDIKDREERIKALCGIARGLVSFHPTE